MTGGPITTDGLMVEMAKDGYGIDVSFGLLSRFG